MKKNLSGARDLQDQPKKAVFLESVQTSASDRVGGELTIYVVGFSLGNVPLRECSVVMLPKSPREEPVEQNKPRCFQTRQLRLQK